MIGRVMGILMLLVALAGITLSIAGGIFSGQAVTAIGISLDSTLALTTESLDTVAATLILTKNTVVDVNAGLDTVEQTAVDLSKTLADTRPLVDGLTNVAAEEIPNSVDALQAAVPNIAQVAGVIDATLITLSNFGYKQTIPVPFNPIEFDFSLGIEYDPEVPFDESVMQISAGLEGLPESLRALRSDLEMTNENLQIVSDGIGLAANDLGTINARIAEIPALIDDYLRIVGQINDTMRIVRAQIMQQLDSIRIGIIVLMVVLGVTQLAPLYLGWELLTGRRNNK
jgi:methyl-accepting chemotaxis protein